jgi:uncharacterized protein YggU (UPF0235/DUF167 family)
MKILIFAKPGAKRTLVKKMEDLVPGFDASFSIAVKEPAQDGRANRAVEKALAEHFDVPVSLVRIVAGHTAPKKVIVIS